MPRELPHFSRLRDHLTERVAPIVVLWGWPGTGKRAFLAWLVERDAERVRSATAALAQEEPAESLRALLATPGVEWLVIDSVPGAGLAAVTRELHPAQRLIFTTPQRSGFEGLLGQAQLSVIGPEAWRLLAKEAASMRPQGVATERWREACALSDGWYRLLEIRGRHLVASTEPGDEIDRFVTSEVFALLDDDTLEPEKARWSRIEGTWVEAANAGEPDGDGAARVDTVLGHELGLSILEGEQRRLPFAVSAVVERFLRSTPVASPPSSTNARDRPSGAHLASDEPRSRSRRQVAETPREVFRVKLLGSPALWRLDGDTRHELRWPLTRSMLFLALLCSRPGLAAGKDEVIDALWPEASEEMIRRNLHPTVSLLRKTLGISSTAIRLRSGVYRLDPELDWRIDVLEFERFVLTGRPLEDTTGAAEAPDLGAWEEAWRLYSGPFLEGYEAPWIRERRDDLQRLYLDVLRGLGEAYLAEDRLTSAEDAFRSVLNVDPIQETVHLLIMKIYSLRGRRDLVRKQYERLCVLLQDELGVEPMPSTAAEYHRLMS